MSFVSGGAPESRSHQHGTRRCMDQSAAFPCPPRQGLARVRTATEGKDVRMPDRFISHAARPARLDRLGGFAVVLALVWPWWSPALAGSSVVVKPGDAVRGHPGLTYLDLVRRAVPSLAMNDADHEIEGRLATPPRHLAGRKFEGDPPDPVVLGFMQDQRVLVGGRRRIALIADFGPDPDRAQDTTLLLLYEDAPRPRLLDAADVSTAQDTEFAEHAKLSLGPGDDALVVYSEHDDADLSMGDYLMVSLAGDRLRRIDEVPVTSERACGWSGMERATFSTAPDPGRPYRRIEAAVRVAFKHTDDDCGPGPRPRVLTRLYRASYRWSVAHRRFETGSRDWKRLDALNQAGF
jgi:hypothetical protein